MSKTPSMLRNKIHLRTFLIVPFVLQMVLVAGLVGYLSYRNGEEAVNEVARQLRREINARIEQRVYTFLETPPRINQSNANALQQGWVNATNQSQLEYYFWQQLQIYPSVSSIYFGNTAGGLVNAGREGAAGAQYTIITDEFTKGPFHKYAVDGQGRRTGELTTVPDFDARTRPWYTNAVEKNKAVWSQVYILFTGQDMAISASYPVYDNQRQLLGVASVDLFLSQLSDFLRSLEIGKTGQSFIMEQSGLLLASSTTETPFITPTGQTVPQRIRADQSAQPLIRGAAQTLSHRFGNYQAITTAQQFEFSVNGQRQFLQVSPLHPETGLDWLVVTVIPEADFMARITATNHTTTMLSGLALLLAIGLGIFTAGWITRPVLQLNTSVQALAKGKWERVTIDKSQIAEISELAHSFCIMSKRLNRAWNRLANEITERKLLEAELQVNLEKYRVLFESFPLGVAVTDHTGKILETNQAASHILGLTTTKHQQRGLTSPEWQTIRPNGTPMPVEEYAAIRALKEKRLIENVEMGIEKKPGQIIWINVTAAPLPLEGYGVTVAYSDITQRKQVEEALRESERKLRSIIEHSADAIVLTDETGQIIEWNWVAEQFSGLKRAEVLGRMVWDVQFSVLPADRQTPAVYERFKFLLQSFFQTGQHPGINQINEVEVQRSDGSSVVLQTSDFSIKTEKGFLLGSIIRDITGRKHMENALRESEERLDMALTGADLGTWDWDIVTGQVVFNKRWAELLGYTLAEIEPNVSAWEKLLHPDDVSKVMTTLNEHLAGHTPIYQTDHRLLTKSGNWKWILDTGKVTRRDEQGKPLRAAGTHQDITERKQAEVEREDLIIKLQNALAQVKQLSGLLPICANCKNIRDDQGYWHQIEVYIRDHTDADFSHGICPKCKEKLYPKEQYPFLYKD